MEWLLWWILMEVGWLNGNVSVSLRVLRGDRADDKDKKATGLYAARVTGRPPMDVIEAIEAKGGTYRPRDEVEE
jgi:hypothetical protein